MPKTKAFVSKTDWRYGNPFEVARWNMTGLPIDRVW